MFSESADVPCELPRPAAVSPPPSLRVAPNRSAQILAYVDVLNALCELDRVERAALRLIYWHGRTQAQVADELHLPIDTVRAAVARGMRQVAHNLTCR